MMFKRILVPMDCSSTAECVLPHVEAMTMGKDPVDVTFLCVIRALDKPMADSKLKGSIEEEAKIVAGAYLDNLIKGLTYKSPVHGEVIEGKVASGILEYAGSKQSDLIILSSHGQSGLGHWIRGSIADKILHISNVPVLRIRAGADRKPVYVNGEKMTVVVLLDGSSTAECVLPYVTGLAEKYGKDTVDIVLLRVCELFPYPLQYPPSMKLSWEEYLKYETKRCTDICRSYLVEVQERLKESGINSRLEVPVGDPAKAIVDYLKDNPANLMLLSTHGRSNFREWAFGNIANKVLKGSPTPALLIRSADSSHTTMPVDR